MPGVSTIHACTEVVLNLFTFSDIGDPNSICYQASAVAQDVVSVRMTWQSSGYKKWGYLCGYKKMGIPLNIHIYHISVDSDLIHFFFGHFQGWKKLTLKQLELEYLVPGWVLE